VRGLRLAKEPHFSEALQMRRAEEEKCMLAEALEAKLMERKRHAQKVVSLHRDACSFDHELAT
jgi:hypothetical protein